MRGPPDVTTSDQSGRPQEAPRGFTPGPWVYDGSLADEQGFPCVASAAHNLAICSVIDDGIDAAEQEANAHLIASAPELLEALREAVEDLEQTLRWPYGWECSEEDLLGKARAVIAKAEGREP